MCPLAILIHDSGQSPGYNHLPLLLQKRQWLWTLQRLHQALKDLRDQHCGIPKKGGNALLRTAVLIGGEVYDLYLYP